MFLGYARFQGCTSCCEIHFNAYAWPAMGPPNEVLPALFAALTDRRFGVGPAKGLDMPMKVREVIRLLE